MHPGSRLWFCKIIPEAACDKLQLSLRVFYAANERLALKNIKQSKRGNFTNSFSRHYLNYKEANKKLIIILGS